MQKAECKDTFCNFDIKSTSKALCHKSFSNRKDNCVTFF